MNFKHYILITLAFLLQKISFAAAPTWSVTPSSYQYSMTATAVANINCAELANPSNKIGAFVGGVCRGVSNTSTFVSGKYLASLVIYSSLSSGETVTFKIYNAVTDVVTDAVTTVSFQDNATFGVSSSPFVVLNNNAPTALSLSNSSILESASIGTVVGNLTSTDVDLSQTYTYTLVSGAGSTDNSKFSILGGQLKTAANYIFSVQNSFSVRIRTTDNLNCSFEQTFTLNLIDVNTAPIAIYISDSTINENASILTNIGAFTALDNDTGEIFNYALVAGVGDTNNVNFNIQGNTLRSLNIFNFETKSSYSIRVRVTDKGNNTFDRIFRVLIKDVNDVPTNVTINNSSSGASFAENRLVGSLVGSFATVDEDANNSFSYSFVNITGNNNSDFVILNNQLRTNNTFDYETRQSYSVYIQSNDGNGGLLTKQFLLSVTDSNDAPSDIALSNSSITENLSVRTFVAKLSTSDPDGVGSFVYTLVGGAGSSGNSNFVISNDTLYSNGVFNYESLSSYAIRIQTNDGSLGLYQKSFTINIIDANDVPTAISLNFKSIAENLNVNSTIGTLSTVDQDVSNSFTYSLVSGVGSTDNASFNIFGSSFRSSIVFDFETKSSYKIRLRTNDGLGGIYEDTFDITILNANDAPTNITLSNNSIAENLSANSLVGNLTSTDQDTGSVFTYSFVNNIGNSNASFNLNGNQLLTNSSFDYESQNVYYVYIQTNDGNGGTYVKQFVINVTNTNDVPTAIAVSNLNIAENLSANTFIGKLTSTDPDLSNTSFTYSFVTGTGSTNNGSFSISNDSLYSNSIFDFETKNSYSIRLNTNDGNGGNYQQAFTVTVLNANDAPTAISLSSPSVNENQIIGTTVTTINTTDADAGQTFTYTLVSGLGATNNSLFSISGNQLRTNTIFNYEQQSIFKIRLQTNDGNGGIYTDTFTINVLNTNDAPSNITLSNATISENRLPNSTVGNLSSTDEDLSDIFSYSFASVTPNDNSSFVINGSQLRTASSFNFEAKQLYVVYLTSNDGNGGTFTKQFTVTILDSNDTPTDIDLNNASIAENQTTGSYIGRFSTSDPDAGQVGFVYSLSNGIGSVNNSNFQVRNDSLFSNTVFNYEVKNSYSIRIRTTDIGSLFTEKVYTINITDQNDAPTALNLNNNTITENTANRTLVGSLSTVDVDLNNSFTYSLVSGTGSTNNANFAIINNELRSNGTFNYEIKNNYSIRVQTNDGQGGTLEQVFSININDSNDAPTNISLSTQTFTENRAIGSLISTLSTTDEDVSNQFTYSFSNTGTNDNTSFYLSGNQLRSNVSFDFESKTAYIVNLQTSDGLSSFVKQFVINITDSNDAPTAIAVSNLNIAENLSANTFIGKITSSDVDVLPSFTYSLVSGTGSTNNGSFRVSNDSLYSNSIFDFETKNSYSIRLNTNDGNDGNYQQAFTVTILNANDAPTAISLSNNYINENTIIRSSIGNFSSTDLDGSDNFTYSLETGVGSTDNSAFIISGNILRTNMVFNYEIKNSYSIRVRTDDGKGGMLEQVFNITIADTNDVPTNLLLSNLFVSENASIGRKIADLSTIDDDVTDNFSYSFYNGANNNNSDFFLVANELRTNTVFDYESKNFYLVYLQTNDGKGGVFVKQFVINVKDSSDAPIALNIDNNNINENVSIGSYVGQLSSTDPDQINGFVYSLVGGIGAIDNNKFIVRNDSLLSNALFNFEQKASYSIRVRTTDITNSWIEKQFTININDVNDAPLGISLSSNTLAENSNKGKTIGTLTTNDVDAIDVYTYTLVSGTGSTDNANFNISGSTITSNIIADFEAKNSYNIRVRTTDKNNDYFEDVFVINVLDVNEAPVLKQDTFAINENALKGDLVGTVTATNAETTQLLKYKIISTPNETLPFVINETTGEITVLSELNYELKNQYKLMVIVSDVDVESQSDTNVIIININDAIEVKQALPAKNYMSPNGDGVNDFFEISNVELYKDFSLTIYNEYGLVVYKALNNYNNDWDGTYNGNTLQTAAYFYVFKNNANGNEFKGIINIVSQ